MIKKRCGSVDTCGASDAFLTDLSKAFGYIPREFSIAKYIHMVLIRNH